MLKLKITDTEKEESFGVGIVVIDDSEETEWQKYHTENNMWPEMFFAPAEAAQLTVYLSYIEKDVMADFESLDQFYEKCDVAIVLYDSGKKTVMCQRECSPNQQSVEACMNDMLQEIGQQAYNASL